MTISGNKDFNKFHAHTNLFLGIWSKNYPHFYETLNTNTYFTRQDNYILKNKLCTLKPNFEILDSFTRHMKMIEIDECNIVCIKLSSLPTYETMKIKIATKPNDIWKLVVSDKFGKEMGSCFIACTN